ncbi:MAG: hypothetical protein U9R33_00140 [candidate division NC10 bacterium]|nr:hypothetical protein [candidate division NC10 bacterium]
MAPRSKIRGVFSLRIAMPRGKVVKLKPRSLRVKDRRKILKEVPRLRKIKPAKSGK